MVGIDPEEIEQMALRVPSVEFRREIVRVGAASDENGVPQFKEVEMAKWFYPPERANCWDLPIEDFWKKDPRFKPTFHAQYEAWKGGNEAAVTGCPIQECPVIPRTIAEQFRFMKFTSVEQLIEADPTQAGIIPEGAEYQKAARRWYMAAKKTAQTTKIIKENEDLKNKIDLLTREMELLNKKFITLTGGN